MITQEQFKQHYQNLYSKKAVYLWGANTETINKTLTDRLYRAYGSVTYNKSYYDNKAKDYTGRIGADCSGSIYPLSKADNTARGYYNACSKKGLIKDLPANTACLVFNSTLSHVGAYMGDGTTIEMMGDAKNCVKQNIQKSRWAYYGIPNWLETKAPVTTATTTTATNKYSVGQYVKYSTSYKSPTLPCTAANAKGGSGEGQIVAIISGQAKYKISTGVYCNDGDIRGTYTPSTTSADTQKIAIIKNIQRWCNTYCNARLTINGKYDANTKKGLCKALQHCLNVKYKAGLAEDGAFGAKTKAKCKNANATKELSYICQAMLYCKGYDMKHSITNNNLDGSYGAGTKNTVLKFQKNTRGLKQDGICGAATFYSLFNS